MKVDREKIVVAALEILNEVGVDRLSTRMIAERLNVMQPALYWHFKTKKALLAAMNEAMLQQRHLVRRPEEGAHWQEFLVAYSSSFRDALLAWRDGARLHAGMEAGPNDMDDVESILALLTTSGMSLSQAMDLLVALGRYTLGCVLEEQSEMGSISADLAVSMQHPLTVDALAHYRNGSATARFQTGLQLLLSGAEISLKG